MVVFVNLFELIGVGLGLLWLIFWVGLAIKIDRDNRKLDARHGDQARRIR